MKKDLLNATVIQDLEDLEEMEQSTAKVGNASAWAFFYVMKIREEKGLTLRRLLRSFSFHVERCISSFLDPFSFQLQLINW